MAVVQISRIQVRRGRTYGGTGLPQLASGELAWSVDTQELFIGNGSVAEGSPQVGNTKILTQNDLLTQGNLLNLAQVVYKITNPTIVTGVDVNHPVLRTVQVVLDDYANADQFGTKRNGVTDDTAALQRAINQLFLNPANKSSNTSSDAVASRVKLNLFPGIYKITSTIYIPSYASIIGSGIDKTIINFTGTGPVFQFVNDTSSIGNPSSINSTLNNNQPRKITIKELTISSTSTNTACLQLDAVRDSIFEDIKLNGNANSSFNIGHVGIQLNALSDLVTCENNIFKNITINGFTNAVYSSEDILNNTFEYGYFYDLKQAFSLGTGTNLSSTGQLYGPRQTRIMDCKFYNVKQHAVYVEHGHDNQISQVTLINVGNNGSGVSNPIYPQIYFNVVGNNAFNIISDRSDILTNPLSEVVYVPILAGNGEYSSFSTKAIELTQISGYQGFMILPVNSSDTGYPSSSIIYNINYFYKSTINDFTRKGVITISADVDTATLQLSDEYDYTGTTDVNLMINLDFQAKFLDETNQSYVGNPGQLPASILLTYKNTVSGDSGIFKYSFQSFF